MPAGPPFLRIAQLAAMAKKEDVLKSTGRMMPHGEYQRSSRMKRLLELLTKCLLVSTGLKKTSA